MPGPYGIVDPPSSPGDYVNGATPTDHRPVSTGWLWQSGCLKNARVWLCNADHRLPIGVTFSYTYNCRLIVKVGYDLTDNPPLVPDPFLRKLSTFRETSRDIFYAEENVVQKGEPYAINDAFFVYDDVTGDRHMGQSEVSYLDGHADDIPPQIALFKNRKYYCR